MAEKFFCADKCCLKAFSKDGIIHWGGSVIPTVWCSPGSGSAFLRKKREPSSNQPTMTWNIRHKVHSHIEKYMFRTMQNNDFSENNQVDSTSTFKQHKSLDVFKTLQKTSQHGHLSNPYKGDPRPLTRRRGSGSHLITEELLTRLRAAGYQVKRPQATRRRGRAWSWWSGGGLERFGSLKGVCCFVFLLGDGWGVRFLVWLVFLAFKM